LNQEEYQLFQNLICPEKRKQLTDGDKNNDLRYLGKLKIKSANLGNITPTALSQTIKIFLHHEHNENTMEKIVIYSYS